MQASKVSDLPLQVLELKKPSGHVNSLSVAPAVS